MKWAVIAVLAAFASNAGALEIQPSGCGTSHPVHRKCAQFSFVSDKGAAIQGEIFLFDREPSANELISTLSIRVSYIDRQLFFANAPALFPYVGLIKHRLYRDGHTEDSSVHLANELAATKAAEYSAVYSMPVLADRGEFVEVIERVDFAFTDVRPHRAESKWDSDQHRNYKILLNLQQSVPEARTRNCSQYHGNPAACQAAGCAYDRELLRCLD